ncbi:hypothetical protein D9599_11550 [Roseomonas sp. KE2513]|nr:hypothetical protein [Roseomonas sp. KE2513]
MTCFRGSRMKVQAHTPDGVHGTVSDGRDGRIARMPHAPATTQLRPEVEQLVLCHFREGDTVV